MGYHVRLITTTLLSSLTLFLLFVGTSLAQGTASISGTAVDSSQAAVAGSRILLTNVDTGLTRTSTTSDQGFYVFTDLTPGNYTLKAEKTGFKSWEQTSINLTVGRSLTINPQFVVGSTTEQVEVTEAPPLITTSGSNISQVVDSLQIQELPLNGRNALQLVSLAPGVVSTGTAGQFGATQVTFASSGGRDIDTNYSLDGGINIDAFYGIANEYPNPDALQEFAVSSRNYSAKSGRGSTDVSAVTRSGTNSLHGSLYEFLRNTSLDAKPYFTSPGSATPNFHRNQFGGSVGGPIVRDKLFYFLSYQGTQLSGGPGLQVYTTVPLAQRTGDFSGQPTPIIDPQTGKQFPGNVIPTNRITAQATTFYQKFLDAPNQGNNFFQFPNVGTSAQHQGIAKVDYQLTPKDLLTVRYYIDDVPQVGYGNGSGAALDTKWLSDLPTRFQNTTIGEVHTFSPQLLNDFHYSYVRSSFGLFPRIDFSLSGLGYGVSTGNAFSKYGLSPDSQVSVGGAFSAYPGAPTRDIMPTTHIADNVSWVRGNHNINAGIEIYKNRINENQNFFTGGALDFNGQFSGLGASDFLLGLFDSYTQIGGLSSRLHQVLPSGYVQDDIKLAHRLTLSAGVRWDIVTGYNSEQNQLMHLAPGKQSTVFPLATIGLLFPGDAGVPKNVTGTRWNDLAPRLGIAWDVTGSGKTSLRAGFGTFFVPLTRGITFNRLTLIQPFTLQVQINGGDAQNIFAGPPFNGVNPFPRPTGNNPAQLKSLPFVPTAGESSLPTDMKTEAAYEWSLSVQQALWRHGVIEADFVGSSSSHLTTSAESNPAVYTPGSVGGNPISTPSNTQDRRLYPQIGSVNSILNVLSSNYNSLQLVFNQQFAKGASVKSAYTWSKALGVGGAEGEGSSGPRDPFDYRLDYGPLDFDVVHNWVTSFIWEPFAGHDFKPTIKPFAAGWQLGGIATLRTGTPFTVYSGHDNSLTGIGADTADLVPGVSQHIDNRNKADEFAHWFNPAAFTENAIGTFGNVSHNSLRNPGLVNVDVNIQKNFKFYERYGVEFRSSLYNAFNHANLGGPCNSVTCGSVFGEISSTSDPRVIEFGLRLTY
jgi:hypothetical protein